ncbi:MAG: Gfo/Idh/MocA family oxidoreductase [Oscillospiraceae bacterium]|nr:Gfo/Idh/MocA family oxidoreductase [Oscillospiraceae bacterium]
MPKLRIGIIGTGGIANLHLKSYHALENVEVVAGCDIVPGKAKAFFKTNKCPDAKGFDSKEEMFKAVKLDAVSVCTYNSTHAECTVAALEQGLPVLLEKPMCVTMDEARAITAAEKKSGKFVTVGFQPRYDPNMQLLKKIVSSGDLGKIYYVQTGGGRWRGMPGGTFVDKKLAGVGVLADIGCYSLDMVLYALGYPKPLTVSAMTADYLGKSKKYNPDFYKTFSVDDFSSAFIRLEGGLTIDFRTSWAMHMDTTGATIFLGSEKGLKISPTEGLWGGAWDGSCKDVTLFHDEFGIPTSTAIPLQESPGWEENFISKCGAFVKAVKTGGPAPIPTEQIIYNQAIIDGIIRSSAKGCEVKCDL